MQQQSATKKTTLQNTVTGTKSQRQPETQNISDPAPVLPADYQFNLSDFALFLSVMKVQRAYEDVLSIILDEPNLQLKKVQVEQVILNKSGKRAIRLDAWAQDEHNRQFDMDYSDFRFIPINLSKDHFHETSIQVCRNNYSNNLAQAGR